MIGGAESVYEALRRVVGTKGTIVVPSQTVEISDPSTWQYPPVPEAWFDTIREDMPAFDSKRSFSKSMGQWSHFVGHLDDAVRSRHPMYSFTAVGHHAKEVCEHQTLDYPFGEQSPLAKLYELQAKVIMIGTDFETNTCIHLAEHSLGRRPIIEKSKIKDASGSRWVAFQNIELDLYDDYGDC